MHFEYEITADDYVASQILYHKLGGVRRRMQWVAYSVLTGLLFLGIAWSERSAWLGWGGLLLAIVGAWWIYIGVLNLFPARHLRRAYRGSELAGREFKAEVDEGGFGITGELCTWRVQWPGVRLKGEDAQVFILYSQGTIFMFGKKYLSNEQQQELRRLSGLDSST